MGHRVDELLVGICMQLRLVKNCNDYSNKNFYRLSEAATAKHKPRESVLSILFRDISKKMNKQRDKDTKQCRNLNV